MPDERKMAALEGAGFKLRETCLTCIHMVRPIGWVGAPWVSCAVIEPTHAKHTDGARVSVRVDGWCPTYAPTLTSQADIARSGFVRFQEKA